jgi:signal transduction histidine kinase
MAISKQYPESMGFLKTFDLDDLKNLVKQQREVPRGTKDYIYTYLMLEKYAISHDRSLTKQNIRTNIVSKFNAQWFPPRLRLLLKIPESDVFILSELLLEKTLALFLGALGTAATKHVLQEIKGAGYFKGLEVKSERVNFSMLDREFRSDDFLKKQNDLRQLFKDLDAQVVAVLGRSQVNGVYADIFDQMERYLVFPEFMDVLQALPPRVLEEERIRVLGPRAAAAAVFYVVNELLKGEDVQPFLQKIQAAQKLSLLQQGVAFTDIYRDLESFAQEHLDLSISKLREDVKSHVDINELPSSFKILFLSTELQLLQLVDEFVKDFIGRMSLDKKIDLTAKLITTKFPILSFKDGSFDKDAILEKLTYGDKQEALTAVLTEYVNYIYTKSKTILSPEDIQRALKASYFNIQQKYSRPAAKLFELLPLDILTEEERKNITLQCYETMLESVLRQVEDRETHIELSEKWKKMSGDEMQHNDFAELFGTVAEKIKQDRGHDQTERIFERAYEEVQDKYGAYPIFHDLLTALPRGVLEIQRFNILSKEELAKVSKALKRTELMTSQFTNVAAHELKTPLIPILGYAELLMTVKDKKVKKWGEIIYYNALREQKLVDDLLSISKLEAGEMKFQMNDLKITSILTEAFESMILEAQQKGIQIKFIGSKNLPLISGDRQRLMQVITNLFQNALKFTSKGKITITAKLIDNDIRVSITDTGMGIEKENIPKLFQKFVQAQDYVTRKTRGTGLGLAICREIIQAHKGKIWVESQGLGKGSTFFFTLPAIIDIPPKKLVN